MERTAPRYGGGCEFDRLLDRVWDMGGGHIMWGAAPGGFAWVGFHGARGKWEEAVGPTLEHAARVLHTLVLDVDPEEA